jgi:hypothetical protein
VEDAHRRVRDSLALFDVAKRPATPFSTTKSATVSTISAPRTATSAPAHDLRHAIHGSVPKITA